MTTHQAGPPYSARTALTCQSAVKEHLRVCWSGLCCDVSDRSFGPRGLCGGPLMDWTCIPQMPSDLIRLVYGAFESWLNKLDSFSCSLSLLGVFVGSTVVLLGRCYCKGTRLPHGGGSGVKMFRLGASVKDTEMQVYSADHNVKTS